MFPNPGSRPGRRSPISPKAATAGHPLPVTTVGNLPSAATSKGVIFFVTDASSPTWNAILTGGSTTGCIAKSDGTNWRAG